VDRDFINSFATAAAICGKVFPVSFVLTAIGIDRADELGWEYAQDLLDTVLVEHRPHSLFQDLGFNSSAFPGELTYAWINPLRAEVLLKCTGSEVRRGLAVSTLKAHQGLKTRTRSSIALLARLASIVEGTAEQAFARELRWFVASEETAQLAEAIEIEARDGRVDLQLLVEFVYGQMIAWLPEQCVMVLDAGESLVGAVHPETAARFFNTRAIAQRAAGAFTSIKESLGQAGSCAILRPRTNTSTRLCRSSGPTA